MKLDSVPSIKLVHPCYAVLFVLSSSLSPMPGDSIRGETCSFFYGDARLIRDKIGLSYDHETHLFLCTVRAHARISKLVSIGRI